jgi:phosphatidylglycerophosphatase A
MSRDVSHALPWLGRVLITSGGLGNLRPAPGTWGSLPPVVVAMMLVLLDLHGTWIWFGVMSLFVVVFSLACTMFGRDAESHFGRKDPSSVVADETAGQAVTLLLLPIWLDGSTLGWLIAVAGAFFAFRIADIVKLPPASGLQRLRGGAGILIDDLIAGAQAGVVLGGMMWVVAAMQRPLSS